jgi:hypothetical protein
VEKAMVRPEKHGAAFEEDVPPEAFVLLSDAEVEEHLLRRAITEGEAEDAEERRARVTANVKATGPATEMTEVE